MIITIRKRGYGTRRYQSVGSTPGREKPYIESLASLVNGITECQVPLGIADVLSQEDVFEVEHYRSWRTGARQVFAYSGATGLRPNLALFGGKAYMGIVNEIRERIKPLRLWIYDDDNCAWKRIV